MRGEPDEEAGTRRGLYNPYPRGKTARGGLLAVAALVAAAAVAHERLAVQGASMIPTLRPGDRLVVRRWPRRLAPGALVVVTDPRDPLRLMVKRVAAVHGDAVTLLGDNPAASTDSRTWGPVPARAVRGRVVYRYAPAERTGRLRDV